MLLYIILAIVLFILILCIVPINAVFTMAFDNGINGLELYAKYLFIKIPLIPPVKAEAKDIEEQQENDKPQKQKNDIIGSIKKVYHLLVYLKKDIQGIVDFLISKLFIIRDFVIEAHIGVGEPMYTGMLVGAADGFIYTLLGFTKNSMRLKDFTVDIQPDWNAEIFKGGIYLKIHTNLINIFRIGIKLLKAYLKARKILKSL